MSKYIHLPDDKEFIGDEPAGYQPDRVGSWTEVKLDILERYADAYMKIMAGKRFKTTYIDGFAGGGYHVHKNAGTRIPGSPIRALSIVPSFDNFVFVEASPAKAASLRRECGSRSDTTIYCGDCNEVLPEQVLPGISYDRYDRALCFLDPYKMNLQWRVIEAAAKTGATELFIYFPINAINRTVLTHDSMDVKESQVPVMNALWGDESWRELRIVESTATLFGDLVTERKASNDVIVNGYKDRLRSVGYTHLWSVPMKNSCNSAIYYLIHATRNEVGGKIMRHIMSHHGLTGKKESPRAAR